MASLGSIKQNKAFNEQLKKTIDEYWSRRARDFMYPAVHVVPIKANGVTIRHEIKSDMLNGFPDRRKHK